VQHQVGRAIDLKLRGTAYKVTVARSGPHRFRVAIAAGGDEHPSTPTSTASTTTRAA
jgi:hypothetical protein